MSLEHKNWYEKIPGKKFVHPIPTNPSEIFGFCNFAQFYYDIVTKIPNNSTVVEIGTSAGCSTAWMAEFIARSGKTINFYSIDPLPDTTGEESFGIYSQDFDVPMYQLFIRNLKSLNLLKYVNHLRMKSTEASTLFADESVDFVFLDGDHGFESTYVDIQAWLPKVNKQIGLIAGHDYDWETVRQAVSKSFPSGIEQLGTCWIKKFQIDASIQVSKLDFSILED